MGGSGFEGIEGDLNLSPHRAEWMRGNISPETSRLLEEDARYFLHHALSTPCLDVLARADGIYLEDRQGRRYMDFHGNSVPHGWHCGEALRVRETDRVLHALPFTGTWGGLCIPRPRSRTARA